MGHGASTGLSFLVHSRAPVAPQEEMVAKSTIRSEKRKGTAFEKIVLPAEEEEEEEAWLSPLAQRRA